MKFSPHPGNPGGVTTRMGVDTIEPPLNLRPDLGCDLITGLGTRNGMATAQDYSHKAVRKVSTRIPLSVPSGTAEVSATRCVLATLRPSDR